ncbi:MAG: hypothetical protein JWN27_2575 [Candidatus Eremiobacteraeota bacterium]|nr:hypothetical protein [Candidatus Eremiobacteraeota bacterium]
MLLDHGLVDAVGIAAKAATGSELVVKDAGRDELSRDGLEFGEEPQDAADAARFGLGAHGPTVPERPPDNYPGRYGASRPPVRSFVEPFDSAVIPNVLVPAR